MKEKTRFNTLSAHLREVFGCRVHRVAVDAGFTCPTRDGTLGREGCIYCDEAGARAAYVEPTLPIREQVRRGIERIRRRYKAEKFLIYFQPYTNTYAPVERLRALYDEALDHPGVVGLMIGTRPDCLLECSRRRKEADARQVDELSHVGLLTSAATDQGAAGCQPAPLQSSETLDLLEEYHRKTYLWVELGLQSVNDETLKWIGRGHDFAAFERAAIAAKAHGLRLCAHLIVGLPTDRREDHLAAAEALNRLHFDGIKIHCLYVSRKAPLGAVYERQPFPMMTRAEYVEHVCDILERLNPQMVIHRLTSDADRDTLVAPLWCLDKNGILSDIHRELERRNTRQGALFEKVQ